MAYSKSGYTLELNTTLNTTQVTQQLQKMQTYIKKQNVIEVTLKNGAKATKEINTLVDSLGNLYKQEKLISQSGKQLSNKVTDVSAKIRTISTETHKWKSANGELNTVINTTNSIGQRMQTRIKEMTDSTGTLTKITQEYATDATGRWRKVGDAVKEVTQDETKLANASTTVSTANSNIASTSNTAAKAQKSLAASFVETIGKVAKFYVATIPIQAVSKVLTEGVEAIHNYDDALTEMKKVTDLTGESLDSYIDKLTELGANVGRTTTTMTELTTNFLKAGYDEDIAADLAEIAAKYQNTADEELSASDATSVLVSQLKAYSSEGLTAINITDEINQISQDFAVSSGDIGKGLTAAGAALSTYGNSFYDTTALLTAGENFLPVTD